MPWLDDASFGFFAVPAAFRLAQSPCYNEGRIYGMDISSGAAVSALLSDKHDKVNNPALYDQQPNMTVPFRVLDLCCAPGLKLCAIADYLSSPSPALQQQQPENSVVVGVDVSEGRIAICKRIVQKYHVHPETSGKTQEQSDKVGIRLYCGDGTTFGQPQEHPPPQPRNHDLQQPGANGLPNLVFDSETAIEENTVTGKRKRMNKSARARERKRLKSLIAEDFIPGGESNNNQSQSDESKIKSGVWKAKQFDRVLVDAECSTDGSLKHIQKQMMSDVRNDNAIASKLVDDAKLAELVQLQKELAANAFRLLKPGGLMVYSTCSMSEDQNENVVAWLLNEFVGSAFIVPVAFGNLSPSKAEPGHQDRITEGKYGVRFHPGALPDKSDATDGDDMFYGGGFFLSKIGKMGTGSSDKQQDLMPFEEEEDDDDFKELSPKRLVLKRAEHVSDASSSSDDESSA